MPLEGLALQVKLLRPRAPVAAFLAAMMEPPSSEVPRVGHYAPPCLALAYPTHPTLICLGSWRSVSLVTPACGRPDGSPACCGARAPARPASALVAWGAQALPAWATRVAMLMCRAWRRGCELVGCEPAAGWGMLRCFCRRRPGAQAVAAALGALVSVGAVMHGREALTPLGLHLAALPVDVRCGRPRVVMGVLLELRESFRDMAGAWRGAGCRRQMSICMPSRTRSVACHPLHGAGNVLAARRALCRL